MRVLLATIGSRGEVQPVVALALRLRALGHDARVSVPPDFRDRIEDLGMPVVDLGPRMRAAESWDLSSPDGKRRAAQEAVAAQFGTLREAARDCEVLVGCGAVMVAARSVAQLLGIGHVHAQFCPATLPSPHHAPAPWPGWPQDAAGDHRDAWAADAQRWEDTWGAALNAHRVDAGLAPVEDVRDHVLTDQPWLAADPVLGPWPEPGDPGVVQTGAWLLPGGGPLPVAVKSFLDDGAPPVYFGLGSMPAPGGDVGRVVLAAAREAGRRVIVSRGWAELDLDRGGDLLVVGEVDHQVLFPRVAAVVHHGGAGTTTTAARAGVPQVVLPQVYDQHYWARRVEDLGIGAAHPAGMPTPASLLDALERASRPGVRARARAVAAEVRTDGARVAAERLAGGS
ncbi:glycosyltransferase [Saccharopolyspora sp. NPDC002578]